MDNAESKAREIVDKYFASMTDHQIEEGTVTGIEVFITKALEDACKEKDEDIEDMRSMAKKLDSECSELFKEVETLRTQLAEQKDYLTGKSLWKKRAETAEAQLAEKEKEIKEAKKLLSEQAVVRVGLEGELAWWHELAGRHCGTKKVPSLSAYVKELQSTIANRDRTIARLREGYKLIDGCTAEELYDSGLWTKEEIAQIKSALEDGGES